ncbi:J domain-containing protein [Salimicrobium halophilum]|uniref:DnaJ domain-containing protein n=1 Tax=Salimicrobium halophilum TaxID=86666 RepID=A0A1G8SB25_9BACI|nr:DnaJ domain-containing protein [Salimicrobium halophilum]SDJ26419.1 DnaJ domain-containing protein [Salimicrobium halophilum]
MESTMTYYEMLDIPPNAPPDSIKRAYVKKLSQYSEERYAKEFQMITKAYETLGNPVLRKEYDESLRDHPSYASMKLREDYYFEEHYERAWIRFKLGEYEEALEILQEYDEIFPGREEVGLLMSDCFLQLDMLEEAEEKITENMPKGEKEEAWLHLMLRLCFDKGSFEEARPYGLRLLSKDPYNPWYVWKYAKTYTMENDFFSASRIAYDYFSSRDLDMESVKLMILLLFSSSFTGDYRLYEESKRKLLRFRKQTTEENRAIILQNLKEEMNRMAPVHYFYMDLLNLISEMNERESQETEAWLRTARAKKMKNVFYYPDNRTNVLKKEPSSDDLEKQKERFAEEAGNFHPEHTRNKERRINERGSSTWSIVFGLFLMLTLHPFIGFISGLLWYYRAEKIKELWNGLGFALFVTFYIFLFMIKYS